MIIAFIIFIIGVACVTVGIIKGLKTKENPISSKTEGIIESIEHTETTKETQKKELPPQESVPNPAQNPEQQGGCLQAIFLSLGVPILIIIAIIAGIYIFTECKANNNDIDITSSKTGLFIIVEPENDISNLKIKVVIQDIDGVIIDRFTEDLGDVEKGEKYRVAFDDYLAAITGWRYSVEVVGGWKWWPE